MWENSAELGAIGLFSHILDKFLPIYACLVDKYPNFALAKEIRFPDAGQCQCSSVVERFLGKEEVTGPTPVIGSRI